MATIAVIADTHLPRGSRRLPDECLRRLAAADLILHAGDVASAAALAELRELGPVEAVCGNADEAALRVALPRELVLDVEEARIGMTHVPGPAAGRERRLVARFPQCNVVIYGHTHIPQVERVGAVWILNPGSPTERRRAQFRSMLELEVHGPRVRPRLIELP